MNIGACFDEESTEKIGRAVGEELRACGVSVCLGPNVDIMRDPLGGRNYEMYGEDPVLVERTAAAFIKGMQSAGTMACAKHFIANNQESNRETKNTHVSLRTLKELYARGFRAAVKEGGVKSVMSAYNAVNGTFSSYNKMILTDWLKEEWGFDGFVVSDWGAVTGRNDRAIAAGMDLIMHGGFTRGDGRDIIEAVENGTLAGERIDDALERILRAVLWLEGIKNAVPLVYDQERLLEIAYRTNVEGTVLLKNNDVLPLAAGTRAAFAGTRAVHTMECGSGSTYVTTPLHGNLTKECEKFGIESAEFDSADIVIYAAGAEGGENVDRPSMALDQADEEQIAGVLRKAKQAGKKTVVVLNIAGPVDMRNWISDADAIVCEFVPGCTGARAMAAVLSGHETPGGRLPMTFPLRLEDSPASPFPNGEYNDVFYSEGIFVGYRWYERKALPVQFPFGYGLSYTTFAARMVSVSGKWDLRAEESWSVSVEVTNTGARSGSEVIQLYLGQKHPRIPMPEKELMAYAKVWLNPGEAKNVTLTVNRDDLEVYDPQKETMLLPIGIYTVSLGTSAQDLFCESELSVCGKNPYVMDENTTMEEVFANEAAVKLISRYVPSIVTCPDEQKKMLSNKKLGAMLSRTMIQQIPDANQLKRVLDGLYQELAGLDV